MPREEIFHKFKEGTLHSGSSKGPKVNSRKQAIAIAMSYPKSGEKKKRGGVVGRHAQASPRSKGGFGVKMNPALLS